MNRTIRLNQAAAEFVVDLLHQFSHARRYQSRLYAEFAILEEPSELLRQVLQMAQVINAGLADPFQKMERTFVVKVLRPVTLILFREIQEVDATVKALALSYDAEIALDFYKQCLARTEDDLNYYKAESSFEEYDSLVAALGEMKSTLVLSEPERSQRISESLGDSLATIAIKEDLPYRDLLDQLEEVSNDQSDDVILEKRFEPKILDFIK